MNKLYLSFLCLVLWGVSAHAQEKWSLERCVQEALDKSLTLEQVRLNREMVLDVVKGYIT